MVPKYNDTTTVSDSGLTLTLPSDREIEMTRVFNAPRHRVFEAHIQCERLKEWWGPRDYKLVSCEVDVRPGGPWRFVQHGPDGKEYAFRGEYLEVEAPERLVQTFEFEGMPGYVSLETLTLVEHDGRTTLTSHSLFDSSEARDGMLESGMEAGARETWDRLAECLEGITHAEVSP